MFKKLFGKRVARGKWDAGLIWFRLRYLEPAGPTRCINLLSRTQACGRVALYYRPGDAVSELYLGIPESHLRLLQRMVADFGFSLKPKPPEVVIPAAGRLTAVTDLPWDSAFVAHIANELVLVSLVAGESKRGACLPGTPSGAPLPSGDPSPSLATGGSPAAWCLPDKPVPGLTLRPSWNDQPPPAHLVATEPDARRWLLGRSQSGVPLHVAGRVNIYGRQEAVADWLVQQVTQMVAVDHANLVVIDGAGDLVPKLKRKAAVTRLLGERLAYVDMDGISLAGGFNPLAAAPGESGAALVQRWQQWFQGMNVHPQGIQLLAQAQQDGVGDMPGLRKWLKQVERQGHYAAVSSLGLALNRLTANRTLREWLEWPTNRYEILLEGALFFACQLTAGWERQQMVRAVLLGVGPVSGVRLVAHGIGPVLAAHGTTGLPAQMVVSNGPQLPGSQLVFTESGAEVAHRLAARFCQHEAVVAESLQLLNRQEAVVVHAGEMVMTTWRL